VATCQSSPAPRVRRIANHRFAFVPFEAATEVPRVLCLLARIYRSPPRTAKLREAKNRGQVALLRIYDRAASNTEC
jgi:hypothetical protein